MSDMMKKVGIGVRTLRVNRGLSQEQLGELSNLHRTYIGFIERNERNISVNALESVAHGLGMKLSELISYAETVKDDTEGK